MNLGKDRVINNLFIYTSGEGNGNPLQYSCLENPMGGGAWQATDHGVTKSRTGLSDFTFTFKQQLTMVFNENINWLYNNHLHFGTVKQDY